MKFDHSLDQTEAIQKIREKVRSHIRLAEYKKAHKYLTKIHPQFPNSYYIASMLATLGTEDSFVLSDKEMNRDFAIAAKKLRKLLYSTKGASEALKNRNINEYYWFSKQHYKQYLFGLKNLKQKIYGGYYSAGVGAVFHAYKLALKGKKKLAIKWAKTAEKCWCNYFKKVSPDYHDAWYWYALSLGVQGRLKESDEALAHSAMLGKLNIKKDPAFIKMRRMIRESQI